MGTGADAVQKSEKSFFDSLFSPITMKIYFFGENQGLQTLSPSPLLWSKPKKMFSHVWIFFTPHLLTALAKENFLASTLYVTSEYVYINY